MIEVQRTWNTKSKVIPVITAAAGTISESFRKYPSNIPRMHEVKELHKTAIWGTAHILRKVPVLKCRTFNVGYNITCSTNCKYRTAATLFTLNIWFASTKRKG